MTRLAGNGSGDGGGVRRGADSEHRERDRLDGYARELISVESLLEASNARAEELKSQAQETIKLWKV